MDLVQRDKNLRFWWVTSRFSSGLYAWYAVQVHQTKFLIDVGFSPVLLP